MSKLSRIFAIAALSVMGISGAAVAKEGPVATACKEEIAKYCEGKEHGKGEVRDCLEAQKENLSEGCKTALETTGGGKGMGKNRMMMKEETKTEKKEMEENKEMKNDK